MRNSATHSSKDPAKEIALLKTQLEQLSEAVNGTGSSILARGEEALEESLRSARQLIAKYGDTAKAIAQDTVKLKDKAADTLIEQTEARPLTTLTPTKPTPRPLRQPWTQKSSGDTQGTPASASSASIMRPLRHSKVRSRHHV